MAKTTRRTATQPETPKQHCRDCEHSYDWHNRSFHDGHLILCRCPFDAKSKFGQFCKFLSDIACDKFVKRKDSKHGETQ